jgi:hypothetical protein
MAGILTGDVRGDCRSNPRDHSALRSSPWGSRRQSWGTGAGQGINSPAMLAVPGARFVK